jgi:hypothetical protein
MGRASGTRVWRATATIVAVLVIGACGDSSDADEGDPTGDESTTGGDAASAADPEADAQALVFAGCMRENGVDMPDPEPGQQGFFDAFHGVAGRVDRSIMEQALNACDQYFPTYAGAPGHGPGADDEDTLALAECLREQGLDVPDDLFEDGALLDHDQDELQAAMQECSDELSGGDG